jgi:hypothetical protein
VEGTEEGVINLVGVVNWMSWKLEEKEASDGGKFEDASEQAVRRGIDRLVANYVAGGV